MLRRFLQDRHGNMAVLFAVGFAVSAVVSALAVDAAALYHERRQVQAGVDLAAISAVTDPTRAAEIAQSVLSEARLLAPGSTAGLVVEAGHYDPTRPVISDRFRAGQAPFNAVQVSLRRSGTLHFAASFAGRPSIAATGIAAVTPEVSYSLGSRLASLNGGIANAVLSALLGTSVSLSALDYSALATTRVDALSFLDALAQQLNVTAGTYDQVLTMKAGSGAIAAALASLTTGATKTALTTLALSGKGSPVPLGRLFSLGRLGGLELGSHGPGAGLSLSALEVLSAAAALADGERHVSLALGASVPGLVGLRLDLAIGEPPQGGGWFAIGPAGTVVRTAQLRLRIKAQLLGGAILLGAGVSLPIWLDLAFAEARVASASCPSTAAPKGSAVIAVRPAAVRVGLGELSDSALASFGAPPVSTPVRLIDLLLLLRVTGTASAEIAQSTPVSLSFSSAEIGAGTLKTAKVQTPVTSLFGSLLGSLDLTVNVLGLGLASPTLIAQTLRALILPLAPTLDLTIDAILSTLGLGIGEADVRVYGVRCTNAVLVG